MDLQPSFRVNGVFLFPFKHGVQTRNTYYIDLSLLFCCEFCIFFVFIKLLQLIKRLYRFLRVM